MKEYDDGIQEAYETLNEKRYPPKALDYNKVKNPDDFWKLTIEEANRLGGLSWGKQTEIGSIIMWLNMAATQWDKRIK